MNIDRIILQDHVHKLTESLVYQGCQQSFVLFSYLIHDLILISLPFKYAFWMLSVAKSLLSLKTTKFLLMVVPIVTPIIFYIELEVTSLTSFPGFHFCQPELPRMPNIFPSWKLFLYWEIILMYFPPSNLFSRLSVPHSFTHSLYIMVFNFLHQPRWL